MENYQYIRPNKQIVRITRARKRAGTISISATEESEGYEIEIVEHLDRMLH